MNTDTDKKEASTTNVHVGSIVEGILVARDRSAVYIDLGNQGTGIIYGREFYEVRDAIKHLAIGDRVFAKVVEMENDEGYRELSMIDATKDLNWKKLAELKQNEEVVSVKIAGVNKGGLLTTLNGMAAFLPVSQLSAEHYPRVPDADKAKILKELQKFIGKTLEVKVLDVVAEENKLILSEKIKTQQAMQKLLENYKKLDVVEGKITGVADFGAFIKFPLPTEGAIDESVEGLIHISELDWQMVQNPSEVVNVGDVVKAQIINITNGQVFLSLKVLTPNPWDQVQETHKKGDSIEGQVISFSPFGAFVQVAPKIRGLCHISEFKSQQEMEESLKAGQSYQFEILAIEPKEHRMSLKLKS